MKHLVWILVAISFSGFPSAFADMIVSGDVSGTWQSGETITVVGDIRVPPGRSLAIEPDVLVRFTGRYTFLVEGLLTARGEADARITFTRAYPTEDSKWAGFRFDQADDASILEWCHLEYAKRDGPYPEVQGGAVWVEGCSPTFRYCEFNDNYSHNANYNGGGGAVWMQYGCYCLVEYNHIHHNQVSSGGGIVVYWECNPTIRYNVIEHNQALSGGGGIYVGAHAEAVIHGNIIRENSAAGWGGGGINLWTSTIFYGTYARVYNNILAGNSAPSSSEACGGGGIYSRYDTSWIGSNTLVDNQAHRGGGIYVITYSHITPHLFNSILWDDSAVMGPEVYLEPSTGSAAVITFCDIEGGYPGTGNIDVNPFFVNKTAGDLHLLFGSPCRDVGDENALLVPPEDLEGDPRSAGDGVDMGADEFFPHLYFTGDPVPGGAVACKLIGWPNTAPVGLFLSGGVLDPPWPSAFGWWYLEFPVIGPIDLGVVPLDGLILLPATVPAAPPGPYSIFAQALAGQDLTNHAALKIE